MTDGASSTDGTGAGRRSRATNIGWSEQYGCDRGWEKLLTVLERNWPTVHVDGYEEADGEDKSMSECNEAGAIGDVSFDPQVMRSVLQLDSGKKRRKRQTKSQVRELATLTRRD